MVITKDSESFDPGSSPGRTYIFTIRSRVATKGKTLSISGIRAHSSAVEHGIADPAVTGSIPVAPFFLVAFCPF